MFRRSRKNAADQQLFNGIKDGQVEQVRNLLAKTKDLEIRNDAGHTPLHLAAKHGQTQILEMLLQAGAALETMSSKHHTALMLAAHSGFIEIVKLLLNSGAIVDNRRPNGSTALMIASVKGKLDVVRCLIAAGANINAQDKGLDTPLTLASFRGHLPVVRVLLISGANISIRDCNNTTAEMQAKQRGHLRVMHAFECLVGNTFSARLKDMDDDTPDDMTCPISEVIMDDPVVTSGGIAYDRKSLELYFKMKGYPDTLPCPVTQLPIHLYELQNEPCVFIRNSIENYVKSVEQAAKLIPKAAAHPAPPAREIHREPVIALTDSDDSNDLAQTGRWSSLNLTL